LKSGNTDDTANSRKISAQERRTQLFDLVRREGPLSQLELRQLTGWHQATVSVIVRELIERGLLSKQGTRAPGRRSPPQQLLGIAPKLGWCVGIGVEIGRCHVVFLDSCGRVIEAHQLSQTKGDVDAAIVAAQPIVDETSPRLRKSHGALLGVGLGIPGVVDKESGKRLYRISDPEVIDLHAELDQAFGAPGWVENNTRSAALAEQMMGVGREHNEFLLSELYVMERDGQSQLYMSTALCIDGAVRTGMPPTAGERSGQLNHIPVAGFLPEDLDSLGDPDSDAGEALLSFANHVAPFLAAIVDFIGLQTVVLGSNVPCHNRQFMTALRDGIKARVLPLPDRNVQVLPSALEDDATAMGAGLLVIDGTDFLGRAP